MCCHVVAAIGPSAYINIMMSVSLFPKAAAIVASFFVITSVAAAGESSTSAEFPKETAALVEATTAFFDAIEATPQKRDPVPVIRMPQLAQNINSNVSMSEGDALTQKGPVHHLTGYRISWYPVDRMLGSVDFMGTWDGNRNLVCGYLTWDLTRPESPVLDNVTANFLDLGELSTMEPILAHETLLEANCAFGAIDENYAFVGPAG